MDNDKKRRAYEALKGKCDKMITSKFLLAQPCISGILKCIITSNELYQFIKDCTSNIDCENELYKATVDNMNGKVFKLPESKRVMVALITYLLTQFDNNEIDLMEFISFYYSPDTARGYQMFSSSVIEPYCSAVKELFLDKDVDEVQEEKDYDTVNTALIEQSDGVLKRMLTEIRSDNGIEDNIRCDMLLLVESMMIAINKLDYKMIIALNAAFRFAFYKRRRLYKLYRELEELFIEYTVI